MLQQRDLVVDVRETHEGAQDCLSFHPRRLKTTQTNVDMAVLVIILRLTAPFCFMSIVFDIADHVLGGSVYLRGKIAENAGRGCDEVPNKQREAGQSKEEEPGRAGADDGVQNILMRSKRIIGNKQRFPL